MSAKFSSAIVFGATGFIGGALTKRLIEANIKVTAPLLKTRGQLSRPQKLPGLVPLELDDFSTANLKRALSGCEAEVVYNLVGGGVNPADRSNGSLHQGNIEFVSSTLKALAYASIRVFIHAGSWSEYAPPIDKTPIDEDHPLEPISDYGKAKAAAHIQGMELANNIGITFANLRLFHVFGVGEAPFRLMPSLIERLDMGKPIELTSGTQVRDFIYIDDVVEAFIAAASIDISTLRPAYNICTGQPSSVRAIAEEAAKIMGKPADLLQFGKLPAREDETPWVVGSNQSFTTVTGWQPRISNSRGISLMIAAR